MCTITFTSVSALTAWLEQKNFESDSAESFDTWMRNLLKTHVVAVCDDTYDYWACRELI